MGQQNKKQQSHETSHGLGSFEFGEAAESFFQLLEEQDIRGTISYQYWRLFQPTPQAE
jgi:hypothetical protein